METIQSPGAQSEQTAIEEEDLGAEFSDSIESGEAVATSSRAAPSPIPVPIPIPLPIFTGSRTRIWKQDPTVGNPGLRLTFIPGLVLNGPRDSRIKTELAGTTPVVRNASGDFIFPKNTPQSDCCHTYAIVRQTLTMCERLLQIIPGQPNVVPWAWNTGGNNDALAVYPHGFNGANAYYSRNAKRLQFGYFKPQNSTNFVYTCRSLDIVAHETAHAVLDGLKPGWLGYGNPPQTGGLHESFGDITAIFLALSQLDQVDAIISLTKANLHNTGYINFLARLAEQFGLAIGRPMGLRNADNNLKLSQVSNEVHAISQVFTGGIYDVLADIFVYEKNRQRLTNDPAHILLDVSHKLYKNLLEAIIKSPAKAATYSDVVNLMLKVSKDNGEPAIYRTFIRNRFTFREVVVNPTPLTAMMSGTIDLDNADFSDGEDAMDLDCALPDHPSLVSSQNRTGCCGTMQNPEYMQGESVLDANLKILAKEGAQIDEEAMLNEELKSLAKEFK